MTAREWIVSVLIAVHLLAVGVAAIPRPSTTPLRSIAREDKDWAAAALEGPLTTLGETLNDMQRWAQRAFRRVKTATRPYIASGLAQNWSMFSNVLTVQRYMRLDYVVTVPGRPPVVYQELVLPSQPEGQPRLSYRSADKAVRVVLGSFQSSLRDEESDPGDGETAGGSASRLLPLIRYFVGRFCEAHDIPRDAVSRLEVWAGTVPIPPPGRADPFPVEVRWSALDRYRTPTPQPATSPSAALRSTQVQAGVTWQLIHVEERP